MSKNANFIRQVVVPRLPYWKVGAVFLVDLVTLFCSSWLALAIRLSSFDLSFSQYWSLFALVGIVGAAVMAASGVYRTVVRYMGFRDLVLIARSLLLAVFCWAMVAMLAGMSVPRSFVFMQLLMALPIVLGVRLLARWFLRSFLPSGVFSKQKTDQRKFIIYGAGSVGAQLAQAFSLDPGKRVVAFVDDKLSLKGRRLNGISIYSEAELGGLLERHQVADVVLAIANIGAADKRHILKRLARYNVHVKTVPPISELIDGKVEEKDLRDIELSDLLGRGEVAPDPALLATIAESKAIMVTGAGGSIGSELCRQLINHCQPSVLILFEISEYNLYKVHSELSSLAEDSTQIVPILGSVQDKSHLKQLLKQYSVATVYHAAAYKHVPIVEHNTAAGLRNNVIGTHHVAQASIEAGVASFVLISTDKAVRPTNVMGASKRFAEMILQGLSDEAETRKTRFTIVRFGNVLGSSGSVVPLFKKQIEAGGPVTVTHPNITRYFMTIPEAAALVLQASAMGGSGDVFVLDMGEPVRIYELAKQMIRLSGREPYDALTGKGEVDIVFTGLRPGEKLYEELLIGEDVEPTEHPMIMRARERQLTWVEVESALYSMAKLLESGDLHALRKLLMLTVTDYKPQGEIVDFMSHAVVAKKALPVTRERFNRADGGVSF